MLHDHDPLRVQPLHLWVAEIRHANVLNPCRSEAIQTLSSQRVESVSVRLGRRRLLGLTVCPKSHNAPLKALLH